MLHRIGKMEHLNFGIGTKIIFNRDVVAEKNIKPIVPTMGDSS